MANQEFLVPARTFSAMDTASMASAAMAERHSDDRHLERHRPPGGSNMGRLMWRSRTRTAGIRFEWIPRTTGPVLRVVATWKDHYGHPRHTSFSVQCNGLEGALDRAIASRCSCGAPLPDRADLLQRLQQEFATAPHVPHVPQTAQTTHLRQVDLGWHASQLSHALHAATGGAVSFGAEASSA